MKRAEKMEVIQRGIDETALCRCYFTYEAYYSYYYPHAVNERFFLGQEEDDFQLDGYCIRKLSQLKKVEIRDDKCCEINRILGTTAQLARPAVEIESWERIFQSLSALDSYVQIEDALHGEYAIGVIERVFKTKLLLKSFDANGVWCEEGMEIPYGEITTVKWGTRYDRGWKRYFEEFELEEGCR